MATLWILLTVNWLFSHAEEGEHEWNELLVINSSTQNQLGQRITQRSSKTDSRIQSVAQWVHAGPDFQLPAVRLTEWGWFTLNPIDMQIKPTAAWCNWLSALLRRSYSEAREVPGSIPAHVCGLL